LGERSGDEVDKFARCSWRTGPFGLPVLTDCRAWFAGPIDTVVDVGDHTAFVIEPTAGKYRGPVSQLGFQRAREFDAGHPA